MNAEIGVFGGSGFYDFLTDANETMIDTPYGPPSAPIVVGTIAGRSVAFLPRHGRAHQHPPHKINYRANLWAFNELGVTQVIAPTAAGSLQQHVERGTIVIPDQLVDRTSGRAQTFFDGPETVHVPFADPYCPAMRSTAIRCARATDVAIHETGTVVVVEGPRFSTRAESRWFSSMGWEVINMTQHPEAVLARELAMCYLNLSLITDYDVGVDGAAPVTVPEVIEVFNRNNATVKELLGALIPALPVARDTCPCPNALDGARVGGH